MCLIAYCKNHKLSDEQIRNAWATNSDGAGVLWAEKGELKAVKFLRLKELMAWYKDVPDGYPHAVHFRLSTCGPRDEANTHPFFVREGLALMHNGIFSNLGDATRSDTAEFTERLGKLPPNFLNDPGIVKVLDMVVGGYNKVLFMSADGTVTIFNAKAGTWREDGNWYSNSSDKPYAYTQYFDDFDGDPRSRCVTRKESKPKEIPSTDGAACEMCDDTKAQLFIGEDQSVLCVKCVHLFDEYETKYEELEE